LISSYVLLFSEALIVELDVPLDVRLAANDKPLGHKVVDNTCSDSECHSRNTEKYKYGDPASGRGGKSDKSCDTRSQKSSGNRPETDQIRRCKETPPCQKYMKSTTRSRAPISPLSGQVRLGALFRLTPCRPDCRKAVAAGALL
jgi:hypothetical protein